MKTTTALVAILLATASTVAFADTAMTQKFVTVASSGDMFEIESSKLALSRSKNGDVKQVANQIIKDHTKSTASLKSAIAASDSSAKPAPAMIAKHQKMLTKLKKASAENFDAAYLDAQEDAHEDAIMLFDTYAKKGDNASLKQFASKTLPTLKMHKDHVEKLDDKEMGDNL